MLWHVAFWAWLTIPDDFFEVELLEDARMLLLLCGSGGFNIFFVTLDHPVLLSSKVVLLAQVCSREAVLGVEIDVSVGSARDPNIIEGHDGVVVFVRAA